GRDGEQLLPRGGVPDPDGMIRGIASGGEPPAVGAERHAVDPPRMSLTGSQGLPGSRIPDPDGLVPAGRREPPAVRPQGHAVARAVMSPEGEPLFAGGGVPDLYPPRFVGPP